MTKEQALLTRKYDGESIIDAFRDLQEAIEDHDAPTDEHGFPDGEYKLTLTFTPNEGAESE